MSQAMLVAGEYLLLKPGGWWDNNIKVLVVLETERSICVNPPKSYNLFYFLLAWGRGIRLVSTSTSGRFTSTMGRILVYTHLVLLD